MAPFNLMREVFTKLGVSLPLAVLSTGLFFSASVASVSNGTNILIILVDDAGYNDSGFMGCGDIPTPSIDQRPPNCLRERAADG